jgi:cell division protein FtsB
MCFLDRDDIFTQMGLNKKISSVENQKEYYTREIQKLKSGLSSLQSKPEELEKLAREKYYMKKDNEDLFVVISKENPKPKDSFINKIHSIFSKPTQH